MPLSGALRELVFERAEEGGVQGGEAVCLRLRVAFVEDFVERVVGLGFLYNSYNSALVDLRGAWMSALANACLRLATVHFSIGGNAGLVDRYEDVGESACVLAGEGEQMSGSFGGRDVAWRVVGRPQAGAWGSIARPLEGLELVGFGDATGEIDSSPDEEVPTRDICENERTRCCLTVN